MTQAITHGMVCAAQPEAAEAGADVLRAGGNVVDAAIAAALVQTVVDPQMCGIAGMGNMQIYMPGQGIHTSIDFHGRAPLAVRPDMWADRILHEAQDGWGFILKDRVNEIGYQAVTTPMSLRAFDTALRRFGTRSLADVMAPAVDYARQGVLVRPHVSEFWNLPPSAGRDANIGIVTKYPATRKIYVKPDGRVLAVGDLLRNPDMATTLERIATNGVDDFYRGALAKEIVADMEAHGGLQLPDKIQADQIQELRKAVEEERRWLALGQWRGFQPCEERIIAAHAALADLLLRLQYVSCCLPPLGASRCLSLATPCSLLCR